MFDANGSVPAITITIIAVVSTVDGDVIAKNLAHVLQRPAHRFGVPEPDDGRPGPVEGREAVEEAVAQPAEAEGPALREDEVERPVGEGREAGAARADGRGEDLGRIHPGDQAQGGEEEREDEEHADCGAEGGGVGRRVRVEVVRQRGLDAEGRAHAQHRRDQQLAPADPVEERHEDGIPEHGQRAPDADDHERRRRRQPQRGVDARAVVLDDVGAGALRKRLDPASKQHPLARACVREKLSPGSRNRPAFDVDGLTDPQEFVLHEIPVRLCTVQVQASQNGAGFLLFAVLDEPARRLGDEKSSAGD